MLGARSRLAAGAIDMRAGGSVSVGAASTLAARGTMVLEAANRFVAAEAVTAQAGGDLLITAADIMTDSGVVLAAGSTLGLDALGGAVRARGTMMTARDLALHAADAIMLDSSNLTAGERVRLAAGTDATLGGSSLLADDVIVAAGRDLQVNGGSITARESVSLGAGAHLSLESGALVRAHTVSGTADTLTLAASELDAGSNIALAAVRAIEAKAGAALRSGGSTTFNAGNILLASGSTIDAGTVLTMTSGKDLLSDGALRAGDAIRLNAMGILGMADVSAGGQIRATSGGRMQLGSLETGDTADDAVRLASGGSIEGRAGSTLHIAARNGGVVMQAEGGIGAAGSPLRIDARKISAQSRTADVVIDALGDVDLTGAAKAGNFAFSTTGSARISSLDARSIDFTAIRAIRYDRGAFTDGVIRAGAGISATDLQVGASLKLFAPDVRLQATGSASGPLSLTVAGFGAGTLADWADLRIKAPAGVRFDAFHVEDAVVDATTPLLEIADGIVGNRHLLRLPELTMLVSRARIGGEPVTLQARAGTGAYTVTVEGRRVVTDATLMGGQASRSDGGYIDPSMLGRAIGPALSADETAPGSTGEALGNGVSALVQAGGQALGADWRGGADFLPPVALPLEAEEEEDIIVSDSADSDQKNILAFAGQ